MLMLDIFERKTSRRAPKFSTKMLKSVWKSPRGRA
jgi:hypothetical protein